MLRPEIHAQHVFQYEESKRVHENHLRAVLTFMLCHIVPTETQDRHLASHC